MRLNADQARAVMTAWATAYPCQCVMCTIKRGPKVQVFSWPFPTQSFAWWDRWTSFTRAAKGGYA